MSRILVVDNYDSFVYNLVHYLAELGADVVVRRNDAVTESELADIATGTFDGAALHGVLLSPGPGTPDDSGACVPILKTALAGESVTPIFGVCLGLQAIGAVAGGTVARADELLHGKTSDVFHDGDGVLAGLPSPFTATRYHSLAILPETVPDTLEVTARTQSGVIMAARHRTLPIEGVQFHPESVLTQAGHLMLANWLTQCGDGEALRRAPALVDAAEQRRLTAFAV